MTEHTPGPWIWRGKSGSLHQEGTDGYGFGKTVLEPTYEYDEGTDTKISEADARLIAAAPYLLEALEEASILLKCFVSSLSDSAVVCPPRGMFVKAQKWLAENEKNLRAKELSR